MSPDKSLIESLSVKLVACALVAVCLVLGAAGLVLPLIPGLLFVAIGGFIAAKHFPGVERRLRRSRMLAAHLDRADLFSSLSFADELRVSGLFFAKLTLDGLKALGALLSRLAGPPRRRYP